MHGQSGVSLRLGRAHVLTTHRVVIHYARVATLRLPLRVCAIFVILVVGATIGRPSFIKVSLRFERAFNEHPYRFGGFLNLMPVGEGSPLPPIWRKTNGRRNASPTDILFICRGGYYPPAVYKNFFAFCLQKRKTSSLLAAGFLSRKEQEIA